MFQIVCKDETGETFLDAEYKSGSEASEQATFQNNAARVDGRKARYHVVRKASVSSGWKERERLRFLDSTYTPVPWFAEPWILADHFAHVSTDDKSQIAFTESDDKGATDRQTRMRPGRYLERYHSTLGANKIRELCGLYAATHVCDGVKFATTPDEIEDVYTHGPDSCMSHPTRDYDSSIHPTRVYGAGDLAIAYIERDGRITGRTVCWPEKKIYYAIYGDESRLSQPLKAQGYSSSRTGGFCGAKLLRVEENGGFIAPYLDIAEGVDDNGTHLIVSNSPDFPCKETNGLTEDNSPRCNHCGGRCGGNSTTVGGNDWCDSCADNHAFYCDSCEEYYQQDSGHSTFHGMICDNCAENYTECEYCNDYYRDDDILKRDTDSDAVCDRCARRWVETPCGAWSESSDDCTCGTCVEAREELAEDVIIKPPLASQAELEAAGQLTLAIEES